MTGGAVVGIIVFALALGLGLGLGLKKNSTSYVTTNLTFLHDTSLNITSAPTTRYYE